MRRLKFLLIVLILTITTFANENDILGFWKTEKKRAIFSIYKEENNFLGKIVWLDSASVDKNNPDESLRTRPILGSVPMKKLIYKSKKNRWEKGKIYDAESGKIYSCQLTISDDLQKIYLRGFAGISILGRTTTWTRAKKGSFIENSIGKP